MHQAQAAGIVLVMNDLNRLPSEWKACAITEWTAPTDFLLYTPGSELLYTWPKIGPMHFTDIFAGIPGREDTDRR
jgi:hypothetical protein